MSLIFRQERFGWLVFDKRTAMITLHRGHLSMPARSNTAGIKKITSSRFFEPPTLSAPIKIFLELTNKCNLNCSFCSNNSHKRGDVSLSLRQIEGIVKSAKSMGIFEVGLIGGEPLCHPEFFNIVNIINKNGFPIYLNTNGYCSKKILSKLVVSKIHKIKISIDGLEECHEQIRGNGTFNKTISNIKHLTKNGNDVQINFTANMDNEKDIEGVVELSDALGCPLKISPMIPTGRAKNISDKVIDYKLWPKIQRRVLNYIKQKSPSIRVEIASGFIINSCEKVLSEYCFLFTDCGLRSSFLSISCNGKVFNTGKQTEFNNLHEVGSIEHDSLEQIWQSTAIVNSKYFNNCGKCHNEKIDDYFSCSFVED